MPKHYRPPGKKKEGNAAKYVTRSQAVKQLQVTLPLFRKLCIWKGIYPRDPKKKIKGNHQTYYHTKDVAFILHDPLLNKHREIRAHEKKIRKARAKKNMQRAFRLEQNKPTYNLDRQIIERYPRFIDALGDLDDALTMVHLFAALPTLQNEQIDVKRIHNSRRLSYEWQAYIARTHKLRKTFVSVKGIYYQAEVQGQKIVWVVPHSLQQVVTADVDFKVMLTFVEFYETLLAFVNFKLYHSIGVKYPPILDPRLESLAADLYALSRYIATKPEQQDKQLQGHPDESELKLAQLHHQLASNEPGALMHLVEEAEIEDDGDEETKECKSLFENMTFFLTREVPREPLLFVISAFGGKVSWEGDGAPFGESDPSISHQIVDRPTQNHMFLSREYIQPQWVFDSVNARIILPTEDYVVGRIPPPHLSPFVDNEAEGYIPDYAQKIKQLQAAARKQVLPVPAVGNEDQDDIQDPLLEGIADRVEANKAAERKQKMLSLERQYHEELKMELEGVSHSGPKQPSTNENVESRDQEQTDVVDDEAEDMSKSLMSRKKRGLYESIVIHNQRKKAKIKKLESRKQKLEKNRK
ncbi:pescadillo homolog [Amaranthus tricolor]|uniref:pescadillo homolog n=1 Tax=Amaranthus tricolor TaxID=29722 RepID=UPI00258BB095|nr:pescadillo homolog [Amaranthus tricolor]